MRGEANAGKITADNAIKRRQRAKFRIPAAVWFLDARRLGMYSILAISRGAMLHGLARKHFQGNVYQ